MPSSSTASVGARERHILLLTSSYPEWSGDPSGHFVEAEAQELARHEHRVTVIAPGSFRGKPRESGHEAGVRVLRVPGGDGFGFPGVLPRLLERPARSLDIARWFREARRVLDEREADEVIAHFLIPCLWPLTWGFTRPVVAVAHGSDVRLLCQLPRWVLKRLLDDAFDRDVRFRFVAKRLLEQLSLAAGEPHSKELEARSRIRPSPIETFPTPNRAEARFRLGLDDSFVAVCVARLVPGKGVDVALTRAPVPSSTRWVVIGDGAERKRLERLYSHASFLGRLDRPTTLLWLSAADVLVHSSRHEGAPSVIREARQLGTEVWCNDVGDVREWALRDPGIHILEQLEPLRAGNLPRHTNRTGSS